MSWANNSNFPTPCDNIPDQRRSSPLFECVNCECGICDGDEYFETPSGEYCTDCIKEYISDMRKTAST